MSAIPKNPKGPIDIFLSLIQIPSPSGKEKNLVDEIQSFLKSKGIDSKTDDAFKITGGNSGNLIVERGKSSNKKVLFIAHTDTVEKEGDLIQPVIDGGYVKSQGETILGADNKAAVAALLYLILQKQGDDEADSIIVFTTSEENGTMGVNALKDIAESVEYAFPIDGGGKAGTFIQRALGFQGFEILIKGRAAHAAANPEDGVHAVNAAAHIVASLPIGRSPDFVIGIGRIQGGGETNIVPDLASVFGEVRSYSKGGLIKGVDLIKSQIKRIEKTTGAEIKLSLRDNDFVPPFTGENNQACIKIAKKASEALRMPPHFISSPATFEANIIDSFHIPTLGIATGGEGAHSVDEKIEIEQLERLPGLLLEILRAAKGKN